MKSTDDIQKFSQHKAKDVTRVYTRLEQWLVSDLKTTPEWRSNFQHTLNFSLSSVHSSLNGEAGKKNHTIQ